MNPNIIYGLIDPRTLMVRYVGQSTTGPTRPISHGRESKLKIEAHTHKARWIRRLQADGLEYAWTTLEEVALSDLNDREEWWIRYGKMSGWPLTNLTSGGDGTRGYKQSKEHVAKRTAKVAAALRGRTISDEHRAKIVAANLGSKRSEIGVQNMREAQRRRAELERNSGVKRTLSNAARAKLIGRVHSDEHRAKISAALRGRSWSAATHEKMTGRKMSVEAVAKSSAARTGQKRTDEMKQRMREAASAAWERKRNRDRETGTVRVRSIPTEQRAKIAASLTGRKHTDETKKRMSESHRRRRDCAAQLKPGDM